METYKIFSAGDGPSRAGESKQVAGATPSIYAAADTFTTTPAAARRSLKSPTKDEEF
jgi:hypothetical protein